MSENRLPAKLRKFLQEVQPGQEVLIQGAQQLAWLERVSAVEESRIVCGKYTYSRASGLRIEPGNAVIGTPRILPASRQRMRECRKRFFVERIRANLASLGKLNLRTLETLFRQLAKRGRKEPC